MAQWFLELWPAWTIELYMTKYIIGEIFSSGGETLYKNPSDQTVSYLVVQFHEIFLTKLNLYIFLLLF